MLPFSQPHPGRTLGSRCSASLVSKMANFLRANVGNYRELVKVHGRSLRVSVSPD